MSSDIRCRIFVNGIFRFTLCCSVSICSKVSVVHSAVHCTRIICYTGRSHLELTQMCYWCISYRVLHDHIHVSYYCNGSLGSSVLYSANVTVCNKRILPLSKAKTNGNNLKKSWSISIAVQFPFWFNIPCSQLAPDKAVRFRSVPIWKSELKQKLHVGIRNGVFCPVSLFSI